MLNETLVTWSAAETVADDSNAPATAAMALTKHLRILPSQPSSTSHNAQLVIEK
jgi:hypothetical protein